MTSVIIFLISAATLAQTPPKPVYSIVEVSGTKISIEAVNAINLRLTKVSSRADVTRILDSAFAYLPVKLVIHEELPGQLKSFNYDRSPKETRKKKLIKADEYFPMSATRLPALFSNSTRPPAFFSNSYLASQYFPENDLLPDTLIAKDSLRMPIGNWTTSPTSFFVECSNCDSAYREISVSPDSLGYLTLKKEQFGNIDSKALGLAIKTSSPYWFVENTGFYVRFADTAVVKQIEDLANLVLEGAHFGWPEKNIYRSWLFTNTRGVLSSKILERLIQEMVADLQSGKY